jgi:AcrR family transcriptional regulator
VARRVGCAKGLVPYHHGSKGALLQATALALAAHHAAVRRGALGDKRAEGAAALDALWGALQAEVDSGYFAAWLAVVSEPSLQPTILGDAAKREPAYLIPLVARALALSAEDLPQPETINAVLDGCQLLLLQGTPEQSARDAYERLWLSLIGE